MNSIHNNGITLIALIITIIVLLILSGVSIATLTGENRILNNAAKAKENTVISQEKEKITIAYNSVKVENKGKIVTAQELENELKDEATVVQSDNNLIVTFKDTGHKYYVTQEGTIEKIDEEKSTDIEVTLNKEEIILEKGKQETLQVTITPENVTNKDVIWTSTNEEVATVENGVVKAIDYGIATITVKTTSEGLTANCVVKVKDTRTVLEQATDAKPTPTATITQTDDTKGIVMIDDNENEWVWIEVPENGFITATSAKDYDNIKEDLITYAGIYRKGSEIQTYEWTDEWYEGCGIASSDDYKSMYNKMLSSVYTNKGFYISRYEAGIDGSDETTSLARISRTEITSSSPKAVSKQNMIPYSFVYCSDAQTLVARDMVTGDKTSSLLFGIQWDLVCKYLEEKSDLEEVDIKSDSTSWGNYKNSSLTLNRGKYNTNPSSSSSTWKAYDVDTLNYVELQQTLNDENGQLLTTGASNGTNNMNIYDFAGNVYEWTLEKTTIDSRWCAFRGGSYSSQVSPTIPASFRNRESTDFTASNLGFRSTLY